MSLHQSHLYGYLVFDEEDGEKVAKGPLLLHCAHQGARGGGNLQPVQAAGREAEAPEASGVAGSWAAEVEHLGACLLHPPPNLAGGQGVKQTQLKSPRASTALLVAATTGLFNGLEIEFANLI